MSAIVNVPYCAKRGCDKKCHKIVCRWMFLESSLFFLTVTVGFCEHRRCGKCSLVALCRVAYMQSFLFLELHAAVCHCVCVCLCVWLKERRERDKAQENLQHLFLFTRSLCKLPLLVKVNTIFFRARRKEKGGSKGPEESRVCAQITHFYILDIHVKSTLNTDRCWSDILHVGYKV